RIDDPSVIDHVKASTARIDHDVALLERHIPRAVEAGEHARIERSAIRLHFGPGGVAKLSVNRIYVRDLTQMGGEGCRSSCTLKDLKGCGSPRLNPRIRIGHARRRSLKCLN